jgi:hypothetical protein
MRISALIILMTLTGCTMHKTSFDCPMPKNAVSCQSVSSVAAGLHTTKPQSDVIYLKEH